MIDFIMTHKCLIILMNWKYLELSYSLIINEKIFNFKFNIN